MPRISPRLHLLLLAVGVFTTLVSAVIPTFCKCTCFKNSTIILLGPQPSSASSALSIRSLFSPPPESPHSRHHGIAPRSASASCSQCTKAFCLGHHIAFCTDATEEDVQTLCFQRDSLKDRVIVWGFITGSTALLGWAAFRHVAEWRRQGGGAGAVGWLTEIGRRRRRGGAGAERNARGGYAALTGQGEETPETPELH